ncbi:MAG: SDR family NAD(P)-dependent oxidoreductase, partial [Myxococcota bacterium]
MNSRIPSGSIVLVTGASSGIGLHSSVTLARRGLHVVATMRDLGRSQRLDEAMAEAACSCDKVQLDVTDPASVDAALSEITERIGPVEVLVNNAG